GGESKDKKRRTELGGYRKTVFWRDVRGKACFRLCFLWGYDHTTGYTYLIAMIQSADSNWLCETSMYASFWYSASSLLNLSLLYLKYRKLPFSPDFLAIRTTG